MKYDHFNARCVFIDGPIAVYVSEASTAEILEAYERLRRAVEIAAGQLNNDFAAIHTGNVEVE